MSQERLERVGVGSFSVCVPSLWAFYDCAIGDS
jgi:hypothetical protein